MALTGTFVGVGLSPAILTAVNFDSGNKVRVIFNEAMQNTTALTAPTTYSLTALSTQPVYQPVSVTAESVANPTYVELTLAGTLLQGTDNYSVTVDTSVVDVAGNPLSPLGNTFVFSGIGIDTSTQVQPTTLLEDFLVQPTWNTDSQTPKLYSLRRTLTEVTNSNGRQILGYAVISPLKNYIISKHPDIDLFDNSSIVNRTSIKTASASIAHFRKNFKVIVQECLYIGVDQDVLSKIEEDFYIYSDDIGLTHILTTLLVLSAIELI